MAIFEGAIILPSIWAKSRAILGFILLFSNYLLGNECMPNNILSGCILKWLRVEFQLSRGAIRMCLQGSVKVSSKITLSFSVLHYIKQPFLEL